MIESQAGCFPPASIRWLAIHLYFWPASWLKSTRVCCFFSFHFWRPFGSSCRPRSSHWPAFPHRPAFYSPRAAIESIAWTEIPDLMQHREGLPMKRERLKALRSLFQCTLLSYLLRRAEAPVGWNEHSAGGSLVWVRAGSKPLCLRPREKKRPRSCVVLTPSSHLASVVMRCKYCLWSARGLFLLHCALPSFWFLLGRRQQSVHTAKRTTWVISHSSFYACVTITICKWKEVRSKCKVCFISIVCIYIYSACGNAGICINSNNIRDLDAHVPCRVSSRQWSWPSTLSAGKRFNCKAELMQFFTWFCLVLCKWAKFPVTSEISALT